MNTFVQLFQLNRVLPNKMLTQCVANLPMERKDKALDIAAKLVQLGLKKYIDEAFEEIETKIIQNG